MLTTTARSGSLAMRSHRHAPLSRQVDKRPAVGELLVPSWCRNKAQIGETISNNPKQLETSRRSQTQTGHDFPCPACVCGVFDETAYA